MEKLFPEIVLRFAITKSHAWVHHYMKRWALELMLRFFFRRFWRRHLPVFFAR